jgi:hypothetical protein
MIVLGMGVDLVLLPYQPPLTLSTDGGRLRMTPMSTSVTPTSLEAALRERGAGAYVITVGDTGAPHVVYVEVMPHSEGLLAEVGARTASNARARGQVSLLYPARHDDDYSLIVDATATPERGGDGSRLRLVPTRAVLHRPGPAAAPSASPCGSDCVPIPLSSLR